MIPPSTNTPMDRAVDRLDRSMDRLDRSDRSSPLSIDRHQEDRQDDKIDLEDEQIDIEVDECDDSMDRQSPSPSPSDGASRHSPNHTSSPSRDDKNQRKKKTRTVFSRSQVFQLESTFDMKRYLSSSERAGLAASLHLTETQVII